MSKDNRIPLKILTCEVCMLSPLFSIEVTMQSNISMKKFSSLDEQEKKHKTCNDIRFYQMQSLKFQVF